MADPSPQLDLTQQLDAKLKASMFAKDQPMMNLVRMLKTKMMERRTAKGFSGEINDALWVEVIGAYVKSLEKGVSEFEKSNSDAAREQIESLRWEIKACQTWLPTKADEAQTRVWVDEAIAGLGGKEKAKIGAVMGAVMKAHKDDVDGGVVKRVVEAALAP